MIFTSSLNLSMTILVLWGLLKMLSMRESRHGSLGKVFRYTLKSIKDILNIEFLEGFEQEEGE